MPARLQLRPREHKHNRRQPLPNNHKRRPHQLQLLLPLVDVAAILNDLAKKNPEKLDWQRSIADLIKLVGMDISFTARKQLATELHYSGDPNDSASMNIWLRKAVLTKLAQNGGKVPQQLLS
jgi:hypothetical protein